MFDLLFVKVSLPRNMIGHFNKFLLAVILELAVLEFSIGADIVMFAAKTNLRYHHFSGLYIKILAYSVSYRSLYPLTSSETASLSSSVRSFASAHVAQYMIL